ncbi:MAG: TonB-dependent receptor [Thermoflavifilum sp.]|nr:TonB-dependent receptor [Thermoflavifilum sp.]
MRKFWIFLLGFYSLTAGLVHGQTHSPTYMLMGRVIDTALHPQAFATVRVFRLSDSALVDGAITDSLGRFQTSIPQPGDYWLVASLIGMPPRGRQVHVLPSQTRTDLGDVVLTPASHVLATVQINATKPFIEQQPGKVVMNIANSPAATGSDVLDILQKAPGVMVDQDGNISLKGKSGVTVLINGRPTHLSGTQLAQLLKSLRAETIDKIEVISNPSVKYDAEGGAGIIDIRLKKNTQEGINGTANIGYQQGHYGAGYGGVDVYYVHHKLQTFAGYQLYDGTNYNRLNLIRDFYSSDAKTTLASHVQQQSLMVFQAVNHQFKAGFDYDLNDQQSIGMMINGYAGQERDRSHGPIAFRHNLYSEPDSLVVPQTHMNGHWNNVAYNLHYSLKIDTSGQELKLEFNHAPYRSNTDQDDQTQYTLANGQPLHDPLHRKGKLSSSIQIQSAQADYTLPIHHQMQLEAGAKYSHVKSDNQVAYELYHIPDQQWITDSNTTNHFVYIENIMAGYALFSRTLGPRWNLQVGLRVEHTHTLAHQIIQDSLIKRDYTDFFPNIMIKKDFGDQHSLSFVYNRRIDRPDYQSLNPFIFYIDQYTYEVGNPFLQPQLTDAIEMGYSWKQQYNLSINYSHTRDVMMEYVIIDSATKAGYQTTGNLAKSNQLSLNGTVPIRITQWWTTSNFFSIFYQHYQGQLTTLQLNNGKLAWTINTSQQIQLPAQIKAELTAFFRSPMQYGVYNLRSLYRIDLAFQKNILHNKGTIKLYANDIFHTQRPNITISYQQVNAYIRNSWNSQRIGINFSYRFGNQQIKVKAPKASGIEEEQNRIKRGNS